MVPRIIYLQMSTTPTSLKKTKATEESSEGDKRRRIMVLHLHSNCSILVPSSGWGLRDLSAVFDKTLDRHPGNKEKSTGRGCHSRWAESGTSALGRHVLRSIPQ